MLPSAVEMRITSEYIMERHCEERRRRRLVAQLEPRAGTKYRTVWAWVGAVLRCL